MTSKYVRLTTFFFVLFFSISSLADPTLFVFDSASSSNSSTLVEYASDGVWIIETYSEPKNALPNKTGRWVFANKAQADHFMNNMSTVWVLQPLTPGSRPSRYRTELTTQTVWDAPNQWDWNWELKFASWVRANITFDFFTRHNVATDCADVAIATRWIFARIHGLPAAQTVGGTATALFTNESFKAEWANLKRDAEWSQDQVFLAALDYVLNHSYTHTLFRDSYPVAINPGSLIEGNYHLAIHTDSGHTQVMVKVNTTSTTELPLYAAASTVPRAVRDLFEYPFFDSQVPDPASSGLLNMRWPQKINGVWSLVAQSQMPNYSLEQYEPEFMKDETNFSVAVFKRINPSYDPLLRVKENVQTLEKMVIDRIAVVEDGYAYCATRDCSPGTADYEAWSTPSRDKRLSVFIADLEKYVQETSTYFPEVKVEWESSRNKKILSLQNIDYLLSSIQLAWSLEVYDSNPETPIEERWALSPVVFARKVGQELQKKFHEREALLSANTCLGNAACQIDSAGYKKHQSFALDQEIYRLSASVLSYCPNNVVSVCPTFYSAAASIKVKLGSRSVALEQMPEQAAWMNSDPRVAIEVRNGSYGSTRPTRVFQGGIGSVEESANGFVLVKRGSEINLLDKDLKDVWIQGALSGPSAFNKETGEVVFYSSGVLTLKRIDGSESPQVITLDEASSLSWVGPRILMAISAESANPKIQLFRLDRNAAASTLVWMDSTTDFDISYMNIFKDGRSSRLFNFRTQDASGNTTFHFYNLTTAQKVDVNFSPSDGLHGDLIAHNEVNGRILVEYRNGANNLRFGWLRLSDGQFQALAIEPTQVRFIHDDVMLMQSFSGTVSTTEILTFKTDGRINLQFKVGSEILENKINDGYFGVRTDDVVSVLLYHSGGIASTFMVPAGSFLGNDPGPFVMVYGNGMGLDIFSQNTGDLLLSDQLVLSSDNFNRADPYVLDMPKMSEPWMHYKPVLGDGLPLMTTAVAPGFWMDTVSDPHIGRFRTIGNMGTGTTILFRKN